MAIATISVPMPGGQHGFPYLRALATPTSLESKVPCVVGYAIGSFNYLIIRIAVAVTELRNTVRRSYNPCSTLSYKSSNVCISLNDSRALEINFFRCPIVIFYLLDVPMSVLKGYGSLIFRFILSICYLASLAQFFD